MGPDCPDVVQTIIGIGYESGPYAYKDAVTLLVDFWEVVDQVLNRKR